MLDDAGAQERTERLQAHAEELGFDAFGVASAAPADPEGRLRAWLERGMHGRMAWMADDEAYARRMDLERTVPGARSVVALSVSYYRPEGEAEPGTSPRLRVARYARGRDYHRWLKKRVQRLRRRLLELDPGCRVQPTVDTSPVLEREWAVRAGIAWIGKSTMAIHPQLGTYTFLGTLVTDSLLVPTAAPLPDRCGTCTACLDACPTAAFPEPGVLDARRCIAHWTLEAPGPLPDDVPDFAGWIAGCDVCQEVCPWNKFAKVSSASPTIPEPELVAPNPEIFAAVAGEGRLERLLAGTALARTGTSAIRRNARRVLGLPPREGGDEEERKRWLRKDGQEERDRGAREDGEA